MLIKALSDYYDLLASEGSVLPEGFSKVKIHYLICLTAEGKIDRLIDYREVKKEQDKKGKIKERRVPRSVKMFQRTEKPGIDSNIIEHRPVYIFGLNFEDGILTSEDKTNKAKKSHEAFVQANLSFIEELHSPVIDAYRNFLENWKPEEETGNSYLLELGKEYGKSGFAFCLTGRPDELLHEDEKIQIKWQKMFQEDADEGDENGISQCAVSGREMAIARIHSKIKGVYGGLATGSVLIGFNNPSENSYGNEQSYNSNISQEIMRKYTEALNYLLEDSSDPAHGKHKIAIDDLTVVFWAMNTGSACEDLFYDLFYNQSDKMDDKETEDMLKRLLESGKEGVMAEARLKSLDKIDPNVDFYMLGLKPNSSRLAVKFIYRKRYADLLWNIARFQQDMRVAEELKPIPIWRIKRELISPKTSSQNAAKEMNPALITKLFEAIIYGTPYPVSLFETIVRRVKTDEEQGINRIRAGILKACLNRNYKKEEFGVALDKENNGQAYLCGRLFAVLERLQQKASGDSLNRTIKDAYFASASSKPTMVFPKLLRLAQNHLNKVEQGQNVYFSKLMGEIMDRINGEFPETLLLQDQGRFMIGYYHQYQSFFKKNTTNGEMEEKENGN